MKKTFYCKVKLKENPGNGKSIIIDEEGTIVLEEELGFCTSNTAEYASLMFAISDSINTGIEADIITSSQVAFGWFKNKSYKNKKTNYHELDDDPNAGKVNVILSELEEFNKKLNTEDDSWPWNYVEINKLVKVLFIPKKRWKLHSQTVIRYE